jgi:single-strand DNA-binding protein
MAARARESAAPRRLPAAVKPVETAAAGSSREHRNEVKVVGRLAAAAVPKLLPSGDEIVTWRLIVDRGAVDGRRKVDVIDCTAFGARLRRQALGWPEGEVIAVDGALRRRFWRGPGGLQSRYEVEVQAATRRVEKGSVSRRRRSG